MILAHHPTHSNGNDTADQDDGSNETKDQHANPKVATGDKWRARRRKRKSTQNSTGTTSATNLMHSIFSNQFLNLCDRDPEEACDILSNFSDQLVSNMNANPQLQYLRPIGKALRAASGGSDTVTSPWRTEMIGNGSTTNNNNNTNNNNTNNNNNNNSNSNSSSESKSSRNVFLNNDMKHSSVISGATLDNTSIFWTLSKYIEHRYDLGKYI